MPFSDKVLGWTALACSLVSAANAQFMQQGFKQVGTGGVGSSLQGSSVAISADGNTALVGGPSDNQNTGAAWVFTRSAGRWEQQGVKLVGGNAAVNSNQGSAVALSADGNTALIGGPMEGSALGAAWVFARSSDGIWTQQGGKLVGAGVDGFAQQGAAVALSADGNTALVGAPGSLFGGTALVFTRSGGSWSQQGSGLALPISSGSGSFLGASLALSADGNTAVVGGFGASDLVGSAWVFTRSSGVWTEESGRLVGTDSNPANGGTNTVSVALSADGYTALSGMGGLGTFVFARPKPSNASLSSSQNPSLFGGAVTFTATVAGGATGTLTFAVDGVNQATVPLSGSRAQFPISNLSPGNHSVVAAYSGDRTFAASTSNIVTQTVTSLGAISLWANTVVGLDQSTRLPVSLAKPAPPAGLTIYLASNDPSKVTVTPSVFIPGGRTSPNSQPMVNGINVGTVNISATALGYTPDTQSVRVTATLAFARCCVTIYSSSSQSAVLNLSAPAPSGGLTVQLYSDNTKVATVSATVTFAPHTTSANVPLTGVTAGAATIHASVLPDLADVSVKVTVR